MCDKQICATTGSTMLQVSADTGSGSGIINEIFPDELFENDARLNGASTFLINAEGSVSSIYPNSHQQSQVYGLRSRLTTASRWTE